MSEHKKNEAGSPKEKEHITRETLAFMLKLVWREKPSLLWIYALQFVIQFVPRMADIILPKFLIDELVMIISDNFSAASIEQHLPVAALYAGIIVGFTLIMSCTQNVTYLLIDVIREWFTEYIDLQISKHAMEMDFEHTEDPEALDALNKAKEGMDWYSGGVVGIMDQGFTIIREFAALCGVIVIVIMTCPLLLIVQAAALVFITIFNAKNKKIESESFLKLAKSNRVFGYVLYRLADFKYGKDIRLYDSADMMCKKAEEFAKEQVGVWSDQQRRKVRNTWGSDIVNSLRDGLSYFYIGYLAVTKAITIGDFTMCVSCASTLFWSLSNIITAGQEIYTRCKYAHRYLEFIAYPAAMPKGSRAVSEGEHVIEFSHVSFKYPRTDKYVLRDINLTIRSGEHLSVVGLNGAGKTTFIKLLCRLYDVTEGEILVDGVNIKEYSDEEYRRLFAVVFQDFYLFSYSLRENITLGGETDDEEVDRVLTLAGFYEDAQKLPNGLDTMLYKYFDEDGTNLSGGQSQKTAIARALYRDSPIVILDEPTAALDPVAEYDIYRQFDKLVGGKTAIYISHRLSSCKFCDRIAVFAEDTIKEYGTHEQLAEIDGGIYAEMFSAQAQYYS